MNRIRLIGKLSLRGEMRLVGSKILRAGGFAWATLIAVIISNREAMITPTTQFHFVITAVLAPSATLFAALSAYILNDLSDIDIDRVNSPQRLLVTKVVTKIDAIVLIVILDFGALLVGSALGHLPFLILLLEIVGGFAYSFRPAGSEVRFVLKTLSIGIAGTVKSFWSNCTWLWNKLECCICSGHVLLVPFCCISH